MRELGDRLADRMAQLILRYPGGLRMLTLHGFLHKFVLLGIKI